MKFELSLFVKCRILKQHFLLKVKNRTIDFSLKNCAYKMCNFFLIFFVLRYDFKQETKILIIFKKTSFESALAA